MEGERGDIADARTMLRRGYERAVELMDRNKSAEEVNVLVRSINEDYASFMKLCEPLQEGDALPGTPSTKKDYRDGKERFDRRVAEWVEQLTLNSPTEAADTRKPNVETLSVHSGASRFTSSSIRSEKRRSRVKVKLAEAALQIQHSKLLEVKEKARREAAERAEKARCEAAERAEKAQRDADKALREAEEDARRAELDAEHAFQEKLQDCLLYTSPSPRDA